MRINTNISAMNTYGRLTNANAAKSSSLAKLSSGLRINKAGDDAAGLAISEKMKGQVGGLKQAVRNAQDGVSLIQTAEGALNETHAILGRMRDLAVQGANGTLSQDDRAEINKEFDALKTEITRISDTTEFNTKKLLNNNGTDGKGQSFTFQIGANENQTMSVNIKQMSAGALNLSDSSLSAPTDESAQAAAVQADKNVIAAKKARDEAITELGSKQTAQATAQGDFDTENTATAQAGVATEKLKDALGDIMSDKVATDLYDVDALGEDLKGLLGESGVDVSGFDASTTWADFSAAVTGTTTDLTDYNNALDDLNAAKEATAAANEDVTNTAAAYTAAQITATDQIGRTNSADAIVAIDAAIKDVSAQRSDLGAAQNRLGHTVKNLTTTQENLAEANSRIRDVDMAEEMMEFTKNNILSQAATSMLAQANSMPNSVLGLLQ